MQILTAFLVLIAGTIAQTTVQNLDSTTIQNLDPTTIKNLDSTTIQNLNPTTIKNLDPLGPDYEPIPTLQEYDAFNATSDAIALLEAMEGPGTDEDKIISIMTQRSEKQRKEIEKKYKEIHKQDLMEDFKDDLSGDLEDIMTGLLEGSALFLANRLHEALVETWFTDKTAIIDIIAPLTDQEIVEVETAYNRKYHTNLIDELSKEKNDFYRRFLLSLVKNSRRPREMPNEDQRGQEVKMFFSAVDDMDPLDENTLKIILIRREPSYARQLFQLYANATGRSIEQNIKDQTWGTVRDLLLAIVESIQNRAAYFAKRLYRAMDGFGTDEEALTRILVSRAEKDLENIKMQYKNLLGHNLKLDIEDEMSGEDRDAMLALVG